MSVSEQIKLEVALPSAGPFPRVLFFNRFKVEREKDFRLVDFGLLVATELVDGYSCVFPDEALHRNKESLLGYLGRIGRAEKSTETPWKGIQGKRATDVVDVVTMAIRDEMADTGLFAFSLSATMPSKKGGSAGPIPAQPLVLLRSTAEVQKQLIEALYA